MRSILCPHCGHTNPVRSPFPPRCKSCRKRLPFTFPRNVVYILRTVIKPILILALVATVFIASPLFQSLKLATTPSSLVTGH